MCAYLPDKYVMKTSDEYRIYLLCFVYTDIIWIFRSIKISCGNKKCSNYMPTLMRICPNSMPFLIGVCSHRLVFYLKQKTNLTQ